MQKILKRAESVKENIPNRYALKASDVVELIHAYQDNGEGINGLFKAVCIAYDAGFEAGARYGITSTLKES